MNVVKIGTGCVPTVISLFLYLIQNVSNIQITMKL